MIIDGKLEEISSGIVTSNKTLNLTETVVEFLKVDGKRYRKVGYTSYIENFLIIDQPCRLAIIEGSNWNRIVALKANDGEIIIDDNNLRRNKMSGLLFAFIFLIFGLLVSGVFYEGASASSWIFTALSVYGIYWLSATRPNNKIANLAEQLTSPLAEVAIPSAGVVTPSAKENPWER